MGQKLEEKRRCMFLIMGEFTFCFDADGKDQVKKEKMW